MSFVRGEKPGREQKKPPAPKRYPRVKHAPATCPHCQGANFGAVYLQVINKTLIGCRDCKKLRIVIPGNAL